MNEKRWCDLERLGEEVSRQFGGSAYSLHGPSHWRRVERNGILLAKRSGADLLVVRLFAWFHDSRRISDFDDPGHGKRGAEYAAMLRGKLFDLDDEAFGTLVYACTYHTDQRFTDNVTAGTCWDADRLDLGRVAIIPEPDFMNTEFGKEIARAGTLYDFVEESGST